MEDRLMENRLYEMNYLEIQEKTQKKIQEKIQENKSEDADNDYEAIIGKVIKQCFNEEGLTNSKMYVNITLTTPKNIRTLNKKYRNIDKETDVLSFPMFEKEELEEKIKNNDFQNIDILGDMVISIPRVEEQAKEYGHSFERELAYMVVHSFYHLLGYDHIKEEDKQEMRKKEEAVLSKLKICR